MSDPRLGPPSPSLAATSATPSGAYLAALQAIVQALNGENAALTALLSAVVANRLGGLQLDPVTPPAAPASGSIIYVSSIDGHTYVVNSVGTTTLIAP